MSADADTDSGSADWRTELWKYVEENDLDDGGSELDIYENIVEHAWDEVFYGEDPSAIGDHTHHLVRTTDTDQTLDADLAARNDIHDAVVQMLREMDMSAQCQAEGVEYCFTCNEWVGVEFRGHLRSTEDAYYYMGPPPEVQELKRDAVREWREQMLEVRNKHPHIDDLDEASDFLKQQVEEATDQLKQQVESAGGEGE
jgi:hypothetical protein